MTKISLIIPTYNEAKNIRPLCLKLIEVFSGLGEEFEIIVVDDNSLDGTGGVVQELSREHSSVKLLSRQREKGLATAVLSGWSKAEGEILGVIDGDLQHPPELIPLLLQKIEDDPGADIVIASRNIAGGGVSRLSLWRRSISVVATAISRALLSEKLRGIKDPLSGYFFLRRRVIEGKALDPLGYKILLEVLVKGAYRKALEVPYFFTERKRGGSKAGLKQYLISFRHMLKLRQQLNLSGPHPCVQGRGPAIHPEQKNHNSIHPSGYKP